MAKSTDPPTYPPHPFGNKPRVCELLVSNDDYLSELMNASADMAHGRVQETRVETYFSDKKKVTRKAESGNASNYWILSLQDIPNYSDFDQFIRVIQYISPKHVI